MHSCHIFGSLVLRTRKKHQGICQVLRRVGAELRVNSLSKASGELDGSRFPLGKQDAPPEV